MRYRLARASYRAIRKILHRCVTFWRGPDSGHLMMTNNKDRAVWLGPHVTVTSVGVNLVPVMSDTRVDELQIEVLPGEGSSQRIYVGPTGMNTCISTNDLIEIAKLANSIRAPRVTIILQPRQKRIAFGMQGHQSISLYVPEATGERRYDTKLVATPRQKL